MDVHVHLTRYVRICKHMDVQSSSLSATAKRYAGLAQDNRFAPNHGFMRVPSGVDSNLES